MASVDSQAASLPALMSVELVYAAAPHALETVTLRLPVGATAGDALRASGFGERLGEGLDVLRLGLWGRLCSPAEALCDGDRLELLRPLLIDPMEARRQRLLRDGLRQKTRRASPRG
jgi:putative ubiquitin-RnfH superfamily antitoxin RatB of RatAB toxin-antitoxin module